ncbi:hypothetical protein FIBSPDRAFT_801990 [Athelia psychrophila]|uniref:Ubiquitin-activating enzyme E1-like n=1 Tax=Athelia psychrophila TaxID=1759441 RepID=A0A165YH58_9AGAM|nr:hypothetical protein FIBSPDRAFT_801990 [Fibularhizoctonia sp. CBS 109695]
MDISGKSQHAGRMRHVEAILGPELCARLPQTKVLLVGAGGIGCELLKNIVLTGFGHITILDLDTIDLSNLNRQFLFKKKDVKQSKALIAAQTAAPFNPNVRLHPIHGNIKEPQFDIEWFEGFDIVLNALDNLEARRHVNKMCMAAKVPLVESGTAGYLGQVQPLLKDRTECFDCIPKPTPKTFPTCTIRSTPSQPIHCIVWAKSYLLGQLFGEDEDAEGELDDAEKQGENVQEIATLRKEAQAFKAVRTALRTTAATGDAARMVFQKVYNADIRNLLSMSDMWRSRAPPLPLDFDTIQNGTFVLREPEPAAAPVANGAPKTNGSTSTEKVLTGTAPVPPTPAGLKAQRSLTLAENLALFVASTERMAQRLQQGEETILFDKDDDDTLDFVTAAANLRGFAYGIERKTPWEVKEMAGNIIPAIATTNAIVSGLIVLQALHLLRKAYTALRNVHIQFKPAVPLSTINMCPPDPRCGVCSDTYAKVLCDPARVTLRTVVEGILGPGGGDGTGSREVGVYEDKRVLSDPDWDDNMERTLESLNVTRGKFLTIVDEDGAWGTIAIGLGVLPPNHPVDAPAFILPSPLPLPPRKERPATPPPPCDPATSKKRNAPDDDEIIEVEPSSKRAKTNGNGPSAPALTSPSKKRRLEEDGLLLMDSVADQLRDDVIEID